MAGREGSRRHDGEDKPRISNGCRSARGQFGHLSRAPDEIAAYLTNISGIADPGRLSFYSPLPSPSVPAVCARLARLAGLQPKGQKCGQ